MSGFCSRHQGHDPGCRLCNIVEDTMITNGVDLTKDHEGYRADLYIDSQGHPTTGYGTCLDPIGKYNSVKEWHDSQFLTMYRQAEMDYEKLNLDLDPVRQSVVVDMLYARGWRNFNKDTQFFIKALQLKDFQKAAFWLEKIQPWYERVKRRGPRLKKLIETGDWNSIVEMK